MQRAGHHHHHLAQRAGAGLAQGRVVKLVEGDQAVQMLSPGNHLDFCSEHDFHDGDDHGRRPGSAGSFP